MTAKALDPIKAKTRLGNALREYKKTITLNQMQKEVIVGTLLGDACIPLKRLRVQFAQTIARENYIWHLYDIFKNPVGRLCWYAPANTGYSRRWRTGS